MSSLCNGHNYRENIPELTMLVVSCSWLLHATAMSTDSNPSVCNVPFNFNWLGLVKYFIFFPQENTTVFESRPGGRGENYSSDFKFLLHNYNDNPEFN